MQVVIFLLAAKKFVQTGAFHGAFGTAYLRLIDVNQMPATKGCHFDTAIEAKQATFDGAFQDQVRTAVGA